MEEIATLMQADIITERTNTAWNAQGTPTAWTDLWYHFDLLGNTTVISNASGALSSQIDMEAFGTVLSGGQNGFRLTTKQFDEKAGLYYFSARWQCPKSGRFVERSPFNPYIESVYVYCNNNPIEQIDSTGMLFRHINNDPKGGDRSNTCPPKRNAYKCGKRATHAALRLGRS